MVVHTYLATPHENHSPGSYSQGDVTGRRPIVECSVLWLDFELFLQNLDRAADAQQSLVKRCSLYRIGPSIWTAYALFSRRKRALWEINQKYRVLIANTQPAIAEMHRYLKAHR